MAITFIFGLMFVAIAAALAARALTFGRIEAAERLRSIEMYGFQTPESISAQSQSTRELDRIAEQIGRAASGRFSGINVDAVRRDLLGAGFYTLTPQVFVGYQVMFTVALSAFLLLMAFSAPSLLTFAGVIVAGLLGWRLPGVFLQRRAAARRDEIDSELPELIDLLVVSVEAGVGLAAAFQLIGERLSGPLGNELRLVQQEQSMGLSSDMALTKLLDRCETPAVRSFVRSLQQGEWLGVSIGTLLRNLAVEMRTRRRQAAEERAQKAPIKILFPLVFLIFPAMFIVLLGPGIMTFLDTF